MDGKVLEYCVGKPGEPPRIFITAGWEQAKLSMNDGEVCFHQANFPSWPFIITQTEPPELIKDDLPLDWAKTQRLIEAQNVHLNHTMGGCDTPKGRVDTDLNSQTRITQFVTDAAISKMINEPWSESWTMADNSSQEHNADDMISMGKALNTFLSACHFAHKAIKDEINSATIGEEAMAINIDKGYP